MNFEDFVFLISLTNLAVAKQTCEYYHGQLVKIESDEENEELYREAVRLNITPWTGLSDTVEEAKWVWTGSGKRAVFTNWSRGQPSNSKHGRENCAKLNTINKSSGYWGEAKKWNDVSCTIKLGAIFQLVV